MLAAKVNITNENSAILESESTLETNRLIDAQSCPISFEVNTLAINKATGYAALIAVNNTIVQLSLYTNNGGK